MQTKRILFINFGGLGDEILFLPTIQSVKKEIPESHITLALEERSKGITSLTDVIDDVLFANKNFVTIHASSSGKKVIRFKEECSPFELYEEKYYGTNVKEIEFDMNFGETKMFYLTNK